MGKPTRDDTRRLNVGDTTITKSQATRHRNSIRVAKLLNLLHDNAMGTLKKPHLNNVPDPGEPYTLLASQVKSIQILLDKALPTLQAVDITSNVEVPEMSPAQLEQELGKLIRAMPKEQLKRLLAGEPTLKVIEGEVVSG